MLRLGRLRVGQVTHHHPRRNDSPTQVALAQQPQQQLQVAMPLQSTKKIGRIEDWPGMTQMDQFCHFLETSTLLANEFATEFDKLGMNELQDLRYAEEDVVKELFSGELSYKDKKKIWIAIRYLAMGGIIDKETTHDTIFDAMELTGNADVAPALRFTGKLRVNPLKPFDGTVLRWVAWHDHVVNLLGQTQYGELLTSAIAAKQDPRANNVLFHILASACQEGHASHLVLPLKMDPTKANERDGHALWQKLIDDYSGRTESQLIIQQASARLKNLHLTTTNATAYISEFLEIKTILADYGEPMSEADAVSSFLDGIRDAKYKSCERLLRADGCLTLEKCIEQVRNRENSLLAEDVASVCTSIADDISAISNASRGKKRKSHGYPRFPNDHWNFWTPAQRRKMLAWRSRNFDKSSPCTDDMSAISDGSQKRKSSGYPRFPNDLWNSWTPAQCKTMLIWRSKNFEKSSSYQRPLKRRRTSRNHTSTKAMYES